MYASSFEKFSPVYLPYAGNMPRTDIRSLSPAKKLKQPRSASQYAGGSRNTFLRQEILDAGPAHLDDEDNLVNHPAI